MYQKSHQKQEKFKLRKKRKKKLNVASRQKGLKDTTSGHYMIFLSKILDIMVRNDNMRKIYIIIDNAPIHTSKQVEEMIKGRNRGYKFVYRTTYSPELNSIKQFWSLMKGKIKHNSKTIEARIIDATYEIPIRHFKNIIQHSKNHFVIGLNCILI